VVGIPMVIGPMVTRTRTDGAVGMAMAIGSMGPMAMTPLVTASLQDGTAAP
jgi:hypothetical protein